MSNSILYKKVNQSIYQTAPSCSLEKSNVRKILDKILITPSELDGFCLDHFPAVRANFTGGMDRMAMINLLLTHQQEDLGTIIIALREVYPERLNRHLSHFASVVSHDKPSQSFLQPARVSLHRRILSWKALKALLGAACLMVVGISAWKDIHRLLGDIASMLGLQRIACEEYKRACNAGKADACYHAGYLLDKMAYEHGMAENKDELEALKYYIKSCNYYGIADGCYKAGNVSKRRDSIGSNKYYEEACRNGHRKGCALWER